MHVDLSRNSFQPFSNYTRVLMQQGRLMVDADWNEQNDILQSFLRNLAADIIGWHGGVGVTKETQDGQNTIPPSGPFVVSRSSDDKVTVTGGRYYLDGIHIDWPITSEGYPVELANPNASSLGNRLVLVEIWEQPISGLTASGLLDPAFQGLDTCARMELRLRFRMLRTDLDENANELKTADAFRGVLIKSDNDSSSAGVPLDPRPLSEVVLPKLAAWPKRDENTRDDCDDESPVGFTGLENQLYRLEVHSAGTDGRRFWNGSDEPAHKSSAFTLKWSRENGSVVYAAEMGNGAATLRSKWRDDTRAIYNGDWVEVLGLRAESGVLVRVAEVKEANGVISLRFEPPQTTGTTAATGVSLPAVGQEVLVRRWDHRARRQFPLWQGGMLVREETDITLLDKLRQANLLATNEIASVPISLEDNLSVRLSLPQNAILRPGDYWQIPARAATGDILWPRAPGQSGMLSYLPLPASYAVHHYAPLALIKADNSIIDFRRKIEPMAQ